MNIRALLDSPTPRCSIFDQFQGLASNTSSHSVLLVDLFISSLLTILMCPLFLLCSSFGLQSSVAMSLYPHPTPIIDDEQQPPHKKAKLDHNKTENQMMQEEQVMTMEDVTMTDTSTATAADSVPNAAAASTSTSSSSISSSEPLTPYPSPDWSYVSKKILAPMVRIGTLPMRLVAVRMGADIVYSEELIAKKLRDCVRVERVDKQGRKIIDFMPVMKKQEKQQTKSTDSTTTTTAPMDTTDSSSTMTTSTSTTTAPTPIKPPHNVNVKYDFPMLTLVPGEPLVVQLGASNADDALAAAKVVEMDVRAIDLNCGCPKHFSLQGGMGAALLKKPDTLVHILTTLRQNLSVPITCKIRLLDNLDDTIVLAKRLQACGISALTVHARRIDDRPRHRALKEQIHAIAAALTIPVIYNGDWFYGREYAEITSMTGAVSVMSARGAMWNASIFRSDGVMLPVAEIVQEYMSICLSYEHHFANAKYCIMEMLKGHISASELFRAVTRSKDLQTMNQLLKDGMPKEPALHLGGSDYKAPLVIEERPSATPTANLSGDSSTATAIHPHVMTKKERKYQAKQNRKNREGRTADLEMKRQEADQSQQASTNVNVATAATTFVIAPLQPTSASTARSSITGPLVPQRGSSTSTSSSQVTPGAVWSLRASPVSPMSTWLETDLEPDDVLALYLIFQSRAFRVKYIVVGEGTNVAMKLKRMHGYLQLFVDDGLMSEEEKDEIQVIGGFPSKKENPEEGKEFISAAGVDGSPSKNLLDAIPPSNFAYDPDRVLSNYTQALESYLNGSQRGIFILLKPFRELIRVWTSFSKHPHWSGQQIVLYGGFNIRCLVDHGENESESQQGKKVTDLFQSAHSTLIFESFHAFGGGSASMDPTSMPRSYHTFFHSDAAKQSATVVTLKRLISTWNHKMKHECEEFIQKMDTEPDSNSSLKDASWAQAKYRRSQRILAAIQGHVDTQLVCADHGLMMIILGRALFQSYINPVSIQFDSLGNSTMCTPTMFSPVKNIFAVTGLTLKKLDEIYMSDHPSSSSSTSLSSSLKPPSMTPPTDLTTQGIEPNPGPAEVTPTNRTSLTITSTSTTTILSLPSTIISQTSQEYLTPLDFYSLGRSCKLLFGDVKQCKIRDWSIPFSRAVHSFTQPESRWTIGRITCVKIESDELDQLNQLCSQLNDSPPPKAVVVEGQSGSSKPLVSISSPLDDICHLKIECDNNRIGDGPFRLPSKLTSLHLSNEGDDRKPIPITKFILPDTLTRIEWSYGPYANSGDIELCRIPKWPRDLTEFVGAHDRSPIDGLQFPYGLTNLAFDSSFEANFHLVTFPNSITNLELALGPKVPFDQIILPTALKRFHLTVSDSFGPDGIPSLADLPRTCENLQIHLHGGFNLSRIEIPASIKQLSLLLPSYAQPRPTPIAYISDVSSITSLRISRLILSKFDWTKIDMPNLLRLKLEPSTQHANPPLKSNELPSNLIELDLSGSYFWVQGHERVYSEEKYISWATIDWMGVLPQSLRTIRLYSYSYELCSTLCLPTPITSISFKQCFDGETYPTSTATIQPPPHPSTLPTIKLIDLGDTHPSTIETWSRSFPEAQVSGDWITLSSDGHTDLFYRLTYTNGGRLMDRADLSVDQKFAWQWKGQYFDPVYDTFPSSTVVADTPPAPKLVGIETNPGPANSASPPGVSDVAVTSMGSPGPLARKFSYLPPVTMPREDTHHSWRVRGTSILESHRMHMFILGLVLLDLAAVMTEIFIELFSYQSCLSFHSSGEGDDYERPSGIELALEILRYVSIAILSLFVLELIAKLIVFRFQYFTHHLYHLLDALLILTSFFATLLLTGPTETILTFFIFLRLWRVFRLIDGVAIAVETEAHQKEEKLQERIFELQTKLDWLTKKSGMKSTDVEEGEEKKKQFGSYQSTSTRHEEV